MNKISFAYLVVAFAGLAGIGFLLSSPSIEQRFVQNEVDFTAAAKAILDGEKYPGTTHWLRAQAPGEGARYLSFHMGEDYVKDYYKPRIVYIESDKPNKAALCSFDGRLIKKIKPHWYVCKESRF